MTQTEQSSDWRSPSQAAEDEAFEEAMERFEVELQLKAENPTFSEIVELAEFQGVLVPGTGRRV